MQHVYWLAYSLLPGLSLLKKHQLLQHCGGMDVLLQHLRSKQHPNEQIDKILKDLPDLPLDQAKQEMEKLKRNGAWLMSYADDIYPESLKQIADPPLVLFGKGVLPKQYKHYFAVVGTRRPSSYGQRVAKSLCRELSQHGLVLLSGLAAGIDTIAHQNAVDQAQPTVAVLGHGLGMCYPQQNEVLAQKILTTGCLLTEYLYDEKPKNYYFPQRNRIVAGLAQGLLLVEGAKKSGAGITARLALENNKEIYAVPGMIDSPTAYTPNLLIAQGAKIVLSAQDILEDYGVLLNSNQEDEEQLNNKLDPLQNSIMKQLAKEAELFDEILQTKLKVSDQDLLKALVDLEQMGLIARQFDGSWSKI
ncbi:MAG TPA: DNA-processing protein DprA [Oligoflexia bacterium]|nr:DNA-processing protein DprA [Oligoflexia bacterium]HMR24608.1 DNA-processing protein DprA [Oligoflexia bacterium]